MRKNVIKLKFLFILFFYCSVQVDCAKVKGHLIISFNKQLKKNITLGLTLAACLSTGCPFLSTMNLVKFHLIALKNKIKKSLNKYTIYVLIIGH